MVRLVPGGLLSLAAVIAGCVPRGAAPVVPTVEVDVYRVAGRPLDETEGRPRDDGHEPGDVVEVEWKGSWWPATLVERRGARWLIHYDGYDADQDELVTLERIRDRRHPDGDGPEDPLLPEDDP